MNRTAARQKLDQERAALSEKTLAAKAKADEAKARHEAWLKPQRDWEAATKAWKAAEYELTRLTDAVECELIADATEVLKPFRDHLCELFQNERNKYDRRDNPADGKRLAGIREAIAKLDALAVSGESDLRAAGKKIVADIPPRDLGAYGVEDESPKKYETVGAI